MVYKQRQNLCKSITFEGLPRLLLRLLITCEQALVRSNYEVNSTIKKTTDSQEVLWSFLLRDCLVRLRNKFPVPLACCNECSAAKRVALQSFSPFPSSVSPRALEKCLDLIFAELASIGKTISSHLQ